MSRREQIFRASRDRSDRATDRLFGWLLLAQWVVAIGLALVISPYQYVGSARTIHFHVWAALVIGGLANIPPIVLIQLRPGSVATRHVVAIAQMFWGVLLIMITGGRIETHFHIFVSLAVLAFYRDRNVLLTATAVVCVDHIVRGALWPDSVYGIANPEWWRFGEHAAWVVFEDIVLFAGCARALAEARLKAGHAARIEQSNEVMEQTVMEQTDALKDSAERYRALVENTEAISFEYDFEHRALSYLAPQAAPLLERDLSELAEPDFLAKTLHPQDRSRLRSELLAFLAGSRDQRELIEFRIIAASGRVIAARMFLSPAVPGSQRVSGVILDVTRHKEVESEVRQAQRLESVGRLAAGVAHEINTPMQFVADSVTFARDAVTDLVHVTERYRAAADAVIAGEPALELAIAATDAAANIDLTYTLDQLPKAIIRALDGSERITQIVRSLKVFAYEDRGAMGSADLVDALTHTLTVARHEYKLVADVELACEPLPPVTCRLSELNQVFLNIIVNAAHAIGDVVERTAERGKITVTTRADGDDHVVIAIGDTGTGIPEHARDHLFDPFFTTKTLGKGTGQGLSMARSIVEKHGGSLTFETTLGTGTTFFLRLPIRPANAPTELAA